MPWLLREGEVLAALEIARGRAARGRGLLGREGIDGALLLPRTRSVHTMWMRFPIDVAFCDGDMRVLDTLFLRPNRVSRPRLRARCVIEAEAGAFDRWRLAPGDELEVRE
jgi:uncharacterized membrane protein (UPF0127 family)